MVTCRTVLAFGSADVAASTYETTSFSVLPGRLYIASVHSGLRTTTTPNTPTISGLGITWTQVDTALPDDASSSRSRITSFRGVAPSNATGTITTDHGGQNQDRCTVSCDEFDNVDTTTTDGVVQKANNRVTGATSLSVTLAAFGSTNNATYGVFGISYQGTPYTAGSGFTLITHAVDVVPDYTIQTEFRNDNDTGVDMTTTGVEDLGAIAMEIKARSTTITGLSSVACTAPSISVSNLTSGNEVHAGKTSWLTASVSPTANNLILLSVSVRNNSSIDPTISSVTGCGLTWVAINSVVYDAASISRRTVFLYRALGASPSSGQITITTGENDTDVCHCVDQASGIDTSGTNGSGAIVQSATNSAIGADPAILTITLGAFSSPINATYGGFSSDGNETATAGSGFTLLAQSQSSTNLSISSEWKSTNDTSVDMTWSVVGVGVGGVAIEIKNAFPTAMTWVV